MNRVEEMVNENGKVEGNLIGVDGDVFSIIEYTESALRSLWIRSDVKEFVDICLNASSYEEVISMCNSVLE